MGPGHRHGELMILLRKYLYGGETAAPTESTAEAGICSALAQLAAALLSGLGEQMMRERHSALSVFGLEAQKLRERLEASNSPEAIRSISGESGSLLEEFRLAREQMEQHEATEVQKMVTMLNQTVAVLSSGSERSLLRLRQIEGDLRQASALGDIVALKARLTDCLQYVREQRAQEREDAARSLERMERDVQRLQEGVALARGGIGRRAEAERDVAEAVAKLDAVFAVFVLERCPLIKVRFSPVVAERFVSLFAQDLSEHLPGPKKLYRWNDFTVLVSVPGSKPLATRTAELRERLSAMPNERQVDVGQRVAVFSNAHRWTLVRPAESGSPAAAILLIDQFAQL